MRINKKNTLLIMAVVALVIAGVVFMGGCAFYQQFGEPPQGEYLKAIEHSPHYGDGQFNNLESTPMFSDDSSFVGVFLENFFTPNERPAPLQPVPAIKTDLRALDPQRDILIWLGHSSYYLQLAGKRILIDPILSDYASPVSFANQAFAGTTIYTAEDMPPLDYLLLTHDHWDHLDYNTMLSLREKVANVICGLGVGSHLRYWGYDPAIIQEADWFTPIAVAENLEIHVLPARHFSGRAFARNKTLWVGFALLTPELRLFFSGDSGYGQHFAEIGRRLGGFDLVMLDSGQYNDKWRYIHMTPEDAARAAVDLRARALLPSHIGRFCIAKHSWDDPFIRISNVCQNMPYRLLTPLIGETVELDNPRQQFDNWWEALQ